MPELPEVETVARGLRERVIDWEIVSAKLLSSKLRNENPRDFGKRMQGRRFLAIHRRGKNLLIHLDKNTSLWSHLRMTGRFCWREMNSAVDPYDRAIFTLQHSRSGNGAILAFNDVRQFGILTFVPTSELNTHPDIAALGPEPLEISSAEFVALFRNRNRMIKPALLDQGLIAGLGNIYADEALYRARIHPEQAASHISQKKLCELYSHVRELLETAIAKMGTTFDSYVGVNGTAGNFQTYLLAYGRDGEACARCSRKIVRKVIASRSAHFCPKCQKAP